MDGFLSATFLTVKNSRDSLSTQPSYGTISRPRLAVEVRASRETWHKERRLARWVGAPECNGLRREASETSIPKGWAEEGGRQ